MDGAYTQASRSNAPGNSVMMSYMQPDQQYSHQVPHIPSTSQHTLTEKGGETPIPQSLNQTSALNYINQDPSVAKFEAEMNQITNEYKMNVGDASQYGAKSATGAKQASVSHMQPSNTNKAFRGYANVVDKNAKRGAVTNMNVNSGALNQQSGLELANAHHTSGTSIGFKNGTQSQFQQEMDAESRNNIRNILPNNITTTSNLRALQDGGSVIDEDR